MAANRLMTATMIKMTPAATRIACSPRVPTVPAPPPDHSGGSAVSGRGSLGGLALPAKRIPAAQLSLATGSEARCRRAASPRRGSRQPRRHRSSVSRGRSAASRRPRGSVMKPSKSEPSATQSSPPIVRDVLDVVGDALQRAEQSAQIRRHEDDADDAAARRQRADLIVVEVARVRVHAVRARVRRERRRRETSSMSQNVFLLACDDVEQHARVVARAHQRAPVLGQAAVALRPACGTTFRRGCRAPRAGPRNRTPASASRATPRLHVVVDRVAALDAQEQRQLARGARGADVVGACAPARSRRRVSRGQRARAGRAAARSGCARLSKRNPANIRQPSASMPPRRMRGRSRSRRSGL